MIFLHKEKPDLSGFSFIQIMIMVKRFMYKVFYVCLLLMVTTINSNADSSTQTAVVSDGKITLNKQETEFIIKNWPKSIIKAATEDAASRNDFLGQGLALKIKSKAFDDLLDKMKTEERIEFELKLDNYKSSLFKNYYERHLEYPDMNKLAEEKYLVRKDHFAKVYEKRQSSHILVKCELDKCRSEDIKEANFEKAKNILAEINKGEDFNELVVKYSEDPTSKKNKGKLKS